jgi:phosphatidylglycerophosphate synthase
MRHQAVPSDTGTAPVHLPGNGAAQELTPGHFWRHRNLGSHLALDRCTVHNVSIFAAYLAYKLGMTPNCVSLFSGFFSVCTIIAAAFLPANDLTFSILVIWCLSQFAYLLDCADGQLARITNRTSELGAFLDKSMDVSGSMLQFGAFSIYVYRHYMELGDTAQAHLFLFAGLIFIFFKVSRFAVWQFFLHMLPETYESSKSRTGVVDDILKNFADHQISLVNMLVFLVSPVACLSIYMVQTVLSAFAWARYFLRAIRGVEGRKLYRRQR